MDNDNKNTRELNELALSAIYLDEKNKLPIYMWFISFEDILKRRKLYTTFFSEELVDFILNCSGAMSFKNEKFYGIIINNNGFDKFNSDTKNFIIFHEIGHIMNGDLENNERSFFEKEYMADKYAKENGFKIKCSAWKLAWWEAYSLIPDVQYGNKIRNNIIRCIIFIKHFISYLFK